MLSVYILRVVKRSLKLKPQTNLHHQLQLIKPPPPRQQSVRQQNGKQSIQNGTKVLHKGNDFSIPHPPQAHRQAQQPDYEDKPDWNSCAEEEEPQPITRQNTQPARSTQEPQPITRSSTQIHEPRRKLSTGERKKWDTPKVPQQPDTGYNRYSSSLSPRDRITSSLNTDALGRGNEEVVDLVLGVNPNLVLTCMVCGLIVLKSQLNTHYHNYCDSSNIQRSVTVPDKTSMRLSKSSSRSKIPQMSNRSSVTKLPEAVLPGKPSPPSRTSPPSCTSPPRTSPPQSSPTRTSPPTAESDEWFKCQQCGEEFGQFKIIEHEEECFKNSETAPYTTNTFNRASSPSSNVVGKVVTGRFVTCINCGKAFTVRSLVIHQKSCLK